MHRLLACCLGTLIIGIPSLNAQDLLPVDEAAGRLWVRHVIPLPKEIQITGKRRLPTSRIAIEVRGERSPIVDQAEKELSELLWPHGAPSRDKTYCRIVLQLGGAEAEKLSSLKNSTQAYTITTDAALTQLHLIARAPAGLYYAAKTLQDLIRPTLKDGNVELPALKVTDWPDLEDRGFWGADSYNTVQYFADRKMNIIEQICNIGVDEKGKPYGTWKGQHEQLMTLAPRVAVKPVPVVLHLEQVSGKGVTRAHPELAAKGGQEGAFCYAKPAIADVIAGWILALASQPGVEEVDVWMTENLHQQGGCQCDECKKTPYALMELRAILAGWKKATRQRPIGLRVLTSEETEKTNPEILKELPPDVKLWYYHSLLTYTSTETPMVRDYLTRAAADGRWIGMVPSLNVIHYLEPFTSPQFIHYRLSEFERKGLKGLLAYVTPRIRFCQFAVEAAAEWAWNANGRSPREFACAWATKHGMKDPDLFGEWADTLGPVSWDVYGSDWPHGELRNQPAPVAQRLEKGELGELGTDLWGVYHSPWGDIKSLAQLEEDVARADKAEKLAQRLGDPMVRLETRIVGNYIRALQSLYDLRRLLPGGRLAEASKPGARRAFQAYVDRMADAAEALTEWEGLLPDASRDRGFVSRPVKTARTSVEQMLQLASKLEVTVKNPLEDKSKGNPTK